MVLWTTGEEVVVVEEVILAVVYEFSKAFWLMLCAWELCWKCLS